MFKKVKMVKKGFAGGVVAPIKYNFDLGRSGTKRVDLGFKLDLGVAPRKKKAVKIANLDLRRVIKKIKRQEGKKEKKFDTSTYWGARAALKGSSARLSFKGLEGQPPGDIEKDVDPGKRQTRRKEGPTEPWVKGRGWWPRKMDVVPTQRAYRGIINVYEFPQSEGTGPTRVKKYIDTSKLKGGGIKASEAPPELGVVYEEGKGTIPARKAVAPPQEVVSPPKRPPRMKEVEAVGRKSPKDVIREKLKAFKPNLKTADTTRQSVGLIFGQQRMDNVDFTKEDKKKYAPISGAEAWEIVTDIDHPGGPEALYFDIRNTAGTKGGGKFYRKAMR
jgi:hypothetical protein